MTFLLVDRMSLNRASGGSELNEMQKNEHERSTEGETHTQYQQIEIESVIDVNAHWPLYPWLNRFAICHTIRTQLHRSGTLSQATLTHTPPLLSPVNITIFVSIRLHLAVLCSVVRMYQIIGSVNLYWITVRSKVLCDTEYENQIAKTTTTSTNGKKINK